MELMDEPDKATDKSDVTIVEADIAPDVVQRARELGHAVVVLPVRSANGRAVYTTSSLLLVKRLRASGIDVAFLDPPEQRVFEEKNAVELLALGGSILIAFVGAAAWDGVKVLFRARKSDDESELTDDDESGGTDDQSDRPDNQSVRLSVTYVDLDPDDANPAKAWRVEGNGDNVLDAIDKLRKP